MFKEGQGGQSTGQVSVRGSKGRKQGWREHRESLSEPTQFLFLLQACVSCSVGDRITFF